MAIERKRLSADGRIKDVRQDHIERYEWAAAHLLETNSNTVIDAGCNSGYGSAILADALDEIEVTAIDRWRPGLDFAEDRYDRPNITWSQMDFSESFDLPGGDVVVAFEIIEHLPDPRPLLQQARIVSDMLLCSVPNEKVWPHQERYYPEHQRHFTREQIGVLLMQCGWTDQQYFGQQGGYSPVEKGVEGRTIVIRCR
jgi:2-polyprenyl-3-methyl-5-hydroxy-6-metoxy-1,4-benzoquinol methylase